MRREEKEGNSLRSKFLFNVEGEEAETLKKVTVNENKKLGFRLFFLGNEDWDVEVMEVEEIDFEGIKSRLKFGESVFISRYTGTRNEPNRKFGH
jgi:hypothetical protein